MESKTKFINRPTCAIVLSIVAFIFVLTAFIVGRTGYMYDIQPQLSEETPIYVASIEWSWASLYMSFMLVGAFIMFIKTTCCTWQHYKEERNNKLLIANLTIEILAILLTFIAAFGIFMFQKNWTLPEVSSIPEWMDVFKPYTVLSSMSLGLSFFGSVTNLITLAK